MLVNQSVVLSSFQIISFFHFFWYIGLSRHIVISRFIIKFNVKKSERLIILIERVLIISAQNASIRIFVHFKAADLTELSYKFYSHEVLLWFLKVLSRGKENPTLNWRQD